MRCTFVSPTSRSFVLPFPPLPWVPHLLAPITSQTLRHMFLVYVLLHNLRRFRSFTTTSSRIRHLDGSAGSRRLLLLCNGCKTKTVAALLAPFFPLTIIREVPSNTQQPQVYTVPANVKPVDIVTMPTSNETEFFGVPNHGGANHGTR